MAREIPVLKPNDTHRRSVRRLLRATRAGTLATTLEADGSPYASFVTFATDLAGCPLLLLSDLANHTQNLAAEPRCSLLAVEGGISSTQTTARVSIQAVAEKIPAGAEKEALMARFLAAHPAASLYAGFGDFALWRLVPTSAHWVGGFARAVWLEPDFILTPEAVEDFARTQEDTVKGVDVAAAVQALGLSGGGWQIVSADADGVDIGRTNTEDSPYRWAFS